MATQDQIKRTMIALRSTHPKELFHVMDQTQAGIGAVLRMLYESEVPVTAGMIAEFMGVSTARVAVLLKKMTAQKLITKESDPADARVTIVRLSEQGVQQVEQIRAMLVEKLGAVIDQVGMERIEQFIEISREIQTAAKNIQ